MSKENHICPVCGYPDLEESPYDEHGYPSYVICSCCGYEFGFDDSSKKISFEEYRQNWLEEGFEFSNDDDKPTNWDKQQMLKQLENVKNTSWEPRL